MLIVSVRLVVREECLDDFYELMHYMTVDTREDPGCLSYRLYRDVYQSTDYLVVGQWETKSAYEKHRYTKHVSFFSESITKLLKQPYEENYLVKS